MNTKGNSSKEDSREDLALATFSFKKTIPYSYYHNSELKAALQRVRGLR